MLLDSAIEVLISTLFTLLLLWASFHKFSDRPQFQGILAAYGLLPVALLPLFAIAIPLLELGLGLAWLTGLLPALVAAITAGLLTIYTLAMVINILRGNTEIDCGCGLSSSKHTRAGYQRLSTALPVRNTLLIGLALVTVLPANERLLGIVDYFGIALACAGLLLLYAAFNQLLANRQLIESWRNALPDSGENHG